MSVRRAFGTLSPVVYFRCERGHVVLAPMSDLPTPRGCEYQYALTSQRCGLPCVREGAGTLPEIDKLQVQLQLQEREKQLLERTFDAMQTEAGRQRVRDNLYQRMISADTPQDEKDFIREYLKLREENREKYHARFAEYSVYIHAREYDLGKRSADKEQNP